MYQKALDLVPTSYFILDGAGHIIDVNAAGAETLGIELSDLADQRFADYVVPDSTWRFLQHLRVASRSGKRETVRLDLKHADGSSFLADLLTIAETNRNGAVERFHTAIVTVAAELVEAKEEAEQMSRLKTAFLANMSHEIRTPLTGIIGFATVLAKELPEEQREFAELIRGSGRRLMEMLNSVLDLAKIESDQMQLETRRIPLDGEVKKVVDLLTPIAAEKGLELRFFVDGDAGDHVLDSDRAALNRILHNLIGNAIKFTEEGSVTVGVWSDEERIYCDISDTGIGIESQFLPHLFEEFRQESDGTDRSHSGTGLGLAITKRLTDLLGGRIDVASQKGEGTTFSVSFPRTRSEDASDNGLPPAAPLPEPGEAPPLRIMLVEDNCDTQQLLRELLSERYDVSVVGNASEAFLLACQKQFDLLLMDIHLGEGPDGIELLQQLRAMPEYADTAIVAITAYALPGDRERFLDLGFTAYVSKPFDVDELLQLPMQLTS